MRLSNVGSQMEFRFATGCFIGGLLQELENAISRLHFRSSNLSWDEIIQLKMKDGLAACLSPGAAGIQRLLWPRCAVQP